MAPTCSSITHPNQVANYRIPSTSKSETPVRISLACMTCRSRKVRCNGESPCSSCIASNRPCFFDQAKSKRRRKFNPIPHHPTRSFQHESANLPPENNTSSSRGGMSPTGSLEFPQEHLEPTRIPYFRFLGPTAIAPGAPFREISMKLVRDGSQVSRSRRSIHLEPTPLATVQTAFSQLTATSSAQNDEDNRKASLNLSEEEFRRNADVFYDHMGSYLACIRKEDILQSLSQGKASEALKLAISALAECIQPSSYTIDHAEIRSNRAKSLCVPHLSLPSLDTTFTLLLLAYCEFAREKDSGLWMWSGLAFRMATDLGLHKSSTGLLPVAELSSTWDRSEDGLRQRIFWCCYHLDRLISSGTGRVATFLDSEIEIDPPSLQPVICDGPSSHPDKELLSPLYHLTQILTLLGKVSDTFNRSKLHSSDSPAVTMEQFRKELNSFYTGLPPIFHFTVENARQYINAKQGPAFMLLHLWFHSLVIITHNPNSVGAGWSSLDVEPIEPRLLETSQASVRTICDMIAFINVIDPSIVISLPFASQPILIAGLASIPRIESDQGSNWRDFDRCSDALRRMQTRWRGVSWLVFTLDSRARNEQDVDLSTSGGAEVSTSDNSLMNKLVRKTELEFFNSNQPNQRQQFIGLTATGTFHEPASGRLSLVRQPDMNCFISPPSASSVSNSNDKSDGQIWSSSLPPSLINSLDYIRMIGMESLDSTAYAESTSKVKSEEEATGLPSLRTYAESTKVKSEEAMEQPTASRPWVAQPIPQIFWPNVPPSLTADGKSSPKSESSDKETPLVPQSAHPATIGLQDLDARQKFETPCFALNDHGQSLDSSHLGSNQHQLQQDPSGPVFGKEVWDQLFRGEVGVWSSFHHG